MLRYWYSDDGESLPFGRIAVRQLAGAVSDRAGNGNAESTEFFARLRTSCTWQNPVDAVDVNNDGLVTPLDALFVIERLNKRGAEPLPLPADFPDVPPPFYDTKCDNLSTPVDALRVIIALNSRGGGEGESPNISPSLRFPADEPTPPPALTPLSGMTATTAVDRTPDWKLPSVPASRTGTAPPRHAIDRVYRLGPAEVDQLFDAIELERASTQLDWLPVDGFNWS